ncbi:amino acid permease/ SLC12A domain-containing protein [Multifurca ochricompacta]|uniref:Amino acid permease/ SLC12A domain-containing protein n=1 Tax=Multifurca ochricompacta TaxID=376703 RepID=A0AAD4M892_9AGAM|nr:amino acid permease/ SLC12A domain-containing protein [Multifurca ochricompacta]
MSSPKVALDVEVKDFRSTNSFSAGSYPGDSNSAASFYKADLDKVQRKLSGVHVQMYMCNAHQIAGVIGTGLFLGLGQLLSTTGPLGVLLVFLLVGSVAFASIVSVTEMAAFAPVSGSFSHYAARWVDPALGFAVSLLTLLRTCAITLPAEITAAAVLIRFWDHNSKHVSIYVAVFIAAVYLVNLLGPSVYHLCPLIRLLLRLKFLPQIIGGLVLNLGGGPDHKRHGFEYWRNPGPLVSSLEPGALGRFLGLLLGIVYAAFSMCGMEIITLAAAETRNPRKNMITAMRTVFFRIFICYILTGLVVGMLIPSNDPALFKKTGNAGQSPFVLVFNRAGVKVLPHIVNAVVLSSAFSSANGMLYSASRLLFALGVQGHAPKFVTTVSRNGVPYVAIILGGLFSFLAFLNVKNNSGKVFNLLKYEHSVTLLRGSDYIHLISWLMIGVTYLRFYYGLKAQGTGRQGIYGIYRSVFQPYAGMYVIFWSIFFILVSGMSVFWNFNGSDFVAAYINLPFFALLYIGWKITKKTKIVPLSQLDFVTGIPSLEETEETAFLEKPTGMQKVRQFL